MQPHTMCPKLSRLEQAKQTILSKAHRTRTDEDELTALTIQIREHKLNVNSGLWVTCD
jgi:hypothetical protein